VEDYPDLVRRRGEHAHCVAKPVQRRANWHRWPSWIAGSKVELGLDLQGGSDILLKVERDDVIAQRLEDTVSDIRTRLRTVNVGHTGLTGTGRRFSVHIPSPGRFRPPWRH